MKIAATLGHLYPFITMEKASSNTNRSSVPVLLFLLFDLFLNDVLSYLVNTMPKLFSRFWSLFQSTQLDSAADSKVSPEKKKQNYELSRGISMKKDTGDLYREDVEMVMDNLGIFCSTQGKELQEWLGSKDLSGLFDEKEPSLEEVREAFDIFDENKDGFIDVQELQRVLRILGLSEGSMREDSMKMIRTFDENGDGRIDFNEFVKLMENSFC